MRVLFYVEPMAVRNSRTHFLDVARKFAKIIEQESPYDFRMFANEETLSRLPPDLLSKLAHRVIKPTSLIPADFNERQAVWDEGGIDEWVDLIKGPVGSTPYHGLLIDLWHQFNFDVVVTWGENGVVREFARNVGRIHICLEMGCTRSPYAKTLAVDPFGVNGNSLATRLQIEDLRSIVEGPMGAYHAIQAYSEAMDAVVYEQFFMPLPAEIRTAIARQGKKVAFIPLQLYDDANLLVHSKYDTLRDVLLDTVPALVAAGHFVIIKPHPDSRHRPNAAFENMIARSAIAEFEDSILWMEDSQRAVSNASVFAECDVVITVNSSVGFESLYHDRVCVVLGDSAYKVGGVFPSLEEYLDGINYEDYLERIALLRAFILEGYLHDEDILKDASAFGSLIAFVAGIFDASGGHPVEFARRLHSARSAHARFRKNSRMLYGDNASGANDPQVPKVVAFDIHASSATLPLNVSGIDDPNDAGQLLTRLCQVSGTRHPSGILEWLGTQWVDESARREAILKLGLIDKRTYVDRNPDAKLTNPNCLTHFIRAGEVSLESPRRGISLTNFSTSSALAPTPLHDLLARLVEEGQRTGRLAADLSAPERASVDEARRVLATMPNTAAKIVVVAHIYYADLAENLLSALTNITAPFDLIVTLPMWGARRISEAVSAAFPHAIQLRFPNRGRDVGPFAEVLTSIVDRYDLCLKVHTKKGYYTNKRRDDQLGDVWRDQMWRALLGSAAQVDQILQGFSGNPSLAMVGPAGLVVGMNDYPVSNESGAFWNRAGGWTKPGAADVFVAGTMFWARTKVFAPLVDGGVTFDSFEAETGSNDGALAHELERYFGHLACQAGYVSQVVQGATAVDFRIPAVLSKRSIGETLSAYRRDGVMLPVSG